MDRAYRIVELAAKQVGDDAIANWLRIDARFPYMAMDLVARESATPSGFDEQIVDFCLAQRIALHVMRQVMQRFRKALEQTQDMFADGEAVDDVSQDDDEATTAYSWHRHRHAYRSSADEITQVE